MSSDSQLGVPSISEQGSNSGKVGIDGQGNRVIRQGMRQFWESLAQAALFCVLCYLLWWALAWALRGSPGLDHPLLLTVVSLFPAVLAVTALLLRFPHLRPFASIALPGGRFAVSHVGFGFVLGTGAGLSIVAVQWAAGWIEIQRGVWTNDIAWTPALGVGIVILAIGAAGEEMLFRGYGLQQLMRATNPWVAIVGTSFLFAWLHGRNPEFSGPAAVNTGLFGVLFGLALVRFRSLWLPYGMHCGWNLALATVGANLSGLRIRLTDLNIVPTGSAYWTGGAYGPEASPVTTLVVVAIGVVLWKAPIPANPRPVIWDSKPTFVTGEAGQP